MNNSKRGVSRRRFLKQGAGGTGMLAVAGAALSAGTRWVTAATKEQKSNPFAYDLERLEKTDPKLVGYQEVTSFPSGNPEPRRLTLGPDERLYVAGRSGVAVLSRDGGPIAHIALPSPARCVAVSKDGTLYVGQRDHLEVFDHDGQRVKTWDSPGGKTWFTGMSIGDNDLFVADSGNRLILRYDRSGKLAGRIGEKNKERNVPGLIVPSPYLDVELAADGLLRVNDPGRHRVEVYTAGGDFELSWGKPSGAIEGFCGCCNPIGLALRRDGRCVTCEKGLPRVKVYSAEGKFECVVAGPESFPENAKTGSVRDLSDGSMGGLDAAVDAQGRIYILDLVTATVHVMKPSAKG